MSGIGEEMGDVGMAIQRAEDKTAQMQARAGAIDELIASGALEDASAPPATTSRVSWTRSLRSDVEAELARSRAATLPEAIESPSTAATSWRGPRPAAVGRRRRRTA